MDTYHKEILTRLQENDPTLIDLTLEFGCMHYSVVQDTMVAIAKAIESNNILKYLNIHISILDSELYVAIAISNMLKLNKSLIRFQMSGGVWHKVATIISKGLELNKTLTDFEMTNTYIGDKGAIAFAKMLKVNNTLIEFRLDGAIGNKGAIALIKMLKVNNTLQYFTTSYRNIEIEGKIEVTKWNKNYIPEDEDTMNNYKL